MELPETRHPHLVSIGSTLERSLRRNIVENAAVRSAFDDLAFELLFARQAGSSVESSDLLEHTA